MNIIYRNTVYSQHASKLLCSAEIFSTSLYKRLSISYPELYQIERNHLLPSWDFLMTIAGVGLAFIQISNSVPEHHRDKLCCAIEEKMHTAYKDFYSVLLDFVVNVRHMMDDKGADVCYALGYWIINRLELYNITSNSLIPIEFSKELSSAIGYSLLNTFKHWWLSNDAFY
ncbi:MAG: hypothetical protein ACOYVK_06125 [Bacillota bacterium]